jgi:transposase
LGDVLNAIFYVLVEGLRWRCLLGNFPAWQTVYTYFHNWCNDEIWVKLHDQLYEWTRIEQNRSLSPSKGRLDSQTVKTAARVRDEVGFDGGKLFKGRKRFLTKDYYSHVVDIINTDLKTRN